MGEHLVSVIVPVFNARRFLAESVESIVGQDHRPLEIVLVDDGSTDESWRVASKLAGQYSELRVQRQLENRGPAFARNVALSASCGDLITFLDADDRMPPDRVSFQTTYLLDRPELDLVMGAERLVVEPGVEPPAWAQQPLEKHPPYYPMSMMVRPHLFDRVGPFDPSLRVGSDADWLYRASAFDARIAMVDHVMVYRRIHGGNLTYRTAELRQTILRSLRARIADRRKPP